MTNKELINHYPWLTPTNRWSGKRVTDCMGEDGEEGFWPGNPTEHPDYDYEYTELDDMPSGWRIAFGEEMCEELNNEIKTWPQKDQDAFRITDIKEKFGMLRFYTNYASRNMMEIIGKYVAKSKVICIGCGRPAVWISRGWISPWCNICATKNFEHINGSYSAQTPWGKEYIDINEYYKKEED